MVGFGLVYGGPGAVFWSSLARVTSSWVISPLMGAMVSFLVYKFIRRVCSYTCRFEPEKLILYADLNQRSSYFISNISCDMLQKISTYATK
jgi:phosphate/sulfate permease